jgi:hypothetical protein
MGSHDLAWQTSLGLDAGMGLDAGLLGVRILRLDETSWVEFVPGWVRDGDGLLADLAKNAPWAPQKTRVMWDQLVREPRILARWPDLSTLP